MSGNEHDDAASPCTNLNEAIGFSFAALTVTATGTVRRTFAIRHLRAADHFASEVRRIETVHEGAELGEPYDLCSHNVTAAIIVSFAAIEAALDEASEDIRVPPELGLPLEKAPTLEWAQALLAFRGKPTFDKGAEPYQSANALRLIRNGLVHPKAEWDDDMERNVKLSAKVNALNVQLSPFWPGEGLSFPHRCMSAGVAEWAARSARLFIRELRLRLDLPETA